MSLLTFGPLAGLVVMLFIELVVLFTGLTGTAFSVTRVVAFSCPAVASLAGLADTLLGASFC